LNTKENKNMRKMALFAALFVAMNATGCATGAFSRPGTPIVPLAYKKGRGDGSGARRQQKRFLEKRSITLLTS
jgi:hypothetical protein